MAQLVTLGHSQRDVGRKLIESQSMRRYLIKMHIKWKYVVFAFGLTLIGVLMFVRLSPWVAQDVCLDGGGAWRNGVCEH